MPSASSSRSRPRRVESLTTRVPRLERQVDAIRTDLHVRATMRDLGGRFLEGRGTLLHGDFRPARWMPSPRGLRVLAPGLATAGPAALDVGFFVAHLLLADQPHALISSVLQRYRRAAPIDVAEVSACVGLEIIRGRLGARAGARRSARPIGSRPNSTTQRVSCAAVPPWSCRSDLKSQVSALRAQVARAEGASC